MLVYYAFTRDSVFKLAHLKKKKKWEKDILDFKQKTQCLSKFIYVSMYVFVFG